MPASLAFWAMTGPSALSGTTMAMPFTPSPTIVSKVVMVRLASNWTSCDTKVGAGVFGRLLGAGDLGDEPGVVAHLVDVADLHVLGGGDIGESAERNGGGADGCDVLRVSLMSSSL